MRKRNRSLALLLVGAMTVSAMLAGCGNKSETPDAGAPKETADTAEQTGTPAQDSDAAWDTTKEDTIVLSVINGRPEETGGRIYGTSPGDESCGGRSIG